MHAYGCLKGMDIAQADEDFNFSQEELSGLIIEGDCFYEHATIRIGYTAYDVRRAQDHINSKTDNRNIMLMSRDENTNSHHFWYARVVGIYHAYIMHTILGIEKRQIDFLHV